MATVGRTTGRILFGVLLSACARRGGVEAPLAASPPHTTQAVDDEPPPAPTPPLADGPPPAEPSTCEEVGRRTLRGRVVRVCVERDDSDSEERRVSMWVDDVAGVELLPRGRIMSYLERFAAHPGVDFRDVDADGIDDILVTAPSPSSTSPQLCRYVVDGADLVRLVLTEERPSAISLGLSFAGIVSGERDPWKQAARVASPISTTEACGILKQSRTMAAFRRHATSDVEIVSYHEPSRPNCATRLAGHGVTTENVGRIDVGDCRLLTCDDRVAFCRNHEPDPEAQYYLFAKGADGRFKLRAMALYGGT